MNILDEINVILKDRKIVSHDIMGFDESEQLDWYYFDLTSNGRKMGIDCCRECTIYLGDWHGHYNPETEWDELIQTLNGIFDNELCSLGAYIGSIEPQNAGCAMLARREEISMEYIVDEFGAGKIVRSCYVVSVHPDTA